jgi:hypothetical protein
MESAVTAPVSGHVKRVVVHEGEIIDNKNHNILDNASTLRGFDQSRRFDGGNRFLILALIFTIHA